MCYISLFIYRFVQLAHFQALLRRNRIFIVAIVFIWFECQSIPGYLKWFGKHSLLSCFFGRVCVKLVSVLFYMFHFPLKSCELNNIFKRILLRYLIVLTVRGTVQDVSFTVFQGWQLCQFSNWSASSKLNFFRKFLWPCLPFHCSSTCRMNPATRSTVQDFNFIILFFH